MNPIISFESFSNEFVSFIRLTAADGRISWGQCSTYNADITTLVFHRQIAPHALGFDLDNIDRNAIADLIHLVEEKEYKCPGGYRAYALAGLDTALWDWWGRDAEKPVVALLGGKPKKLRAYASSMKRDITPEAEAERLVRLRDAYGFDAFKWRVGSVCGRNQDEWEGRTEAIIPLVADALGDGIDKLVDANSCYSPDKAIEVGHRLEDHGIGHFEEPCPYWKLDETKQVRDALKLDVTGGEQDNEVTIWQAMMARKVVDILQPDVMYMGGLTRTLELCEQAQNYSDLTITPHSANLSLVTICTMHLLGAIPNGGKYLEFSIEGEDYYPWQQNLFKEDPYLIIDGKIKIPEQVGWGVEPNPEWLEKANYQKTSLEN